MKPTVTLEAIGATVSAIKIVGDGSIKVCGITHDSWQVQPGFIFAAIKGEKVDGTSFVDRAVAAGAVAILCEEELSVSVPQLIVENAREQLGHVAAACYGEPSGELSLVGITGTNGKTTITYILETVLQYAKNECAVMGTIEYRYKDNVWPADHTTPESTVVQSIMREMVDGGARTLAMEVSSHGLSLGRLNGALFDVVAFTNLTQDHLDFHNTMEEYAAAKMLLFTDLLANRPAAKIVLNMDDPFGADIQKQSNREVLTVSCSVDACTTLHPVAAPVYSIDGIEVTLATPSGEVELKSGLCGEHNLSNLLVAFGICLSLGIPKETVVAAMNQISAVPGRLERVENRLGFSVFVDYAHTPDALVNVLRAVKPLTRGRLICIFGCGGDRDGAKRPLMGEAVAKAADIAVVTSDNPRTEEPESIVDMVLPGVKLFKPRFIDHENVDDNLAHATQGYARIVSRREAIEQCIAAAKEGDTVLIAGKGHEDYVIVGTQKTHFDDREEARRAIAMRRS